MMRNEKKFNRFVGCCGMGIAIFGSASAHAALSHRYSFTTDASDSVGGANGTLFNSATVSGGALQLNNPGFSAPSTAGGYLSLPPSILPSSGSATIEEWFTFTGSGYFSEGWTFSNNANDTNGPNSTNGQYLMFTISAPQGGPNAGSAGGSHIAQTLAGYQGPPAGETDAFETTSGIGAGGGGYLDDGETFMEAAVIDASAGTLSYYLYDQSAGGAGGLQSSITAIPLGSYSFTNAYLGRSAFAGDDSTSGSVDEFRVYNNAQSAAAIAADYAAGPNVVVAVPEPGSLAVVTGLAAVGMLRRRRGQFKTALI